MSEWQPIETAPRDGTPVITWQEDRIGDQPWPGVDDRRYSIGYMRPDGTWGNRNHDLNKPTLWQPLPEPPEPR